MELYNMCNVDENTNFEKYDFFICANGLEIRDTRVAELLETEKYVKKWIVFNYNERIQQDSENQLEQLYKKICDENIISVNTSYSDDSTYERLLEEVGSELNSSKRIGIDITGFKNQCFFPLIKYLKKEKEIEFLDVFYTEPATYKFPKASEKVTIFPNMSDTQKVLFNYAKVEGGVEIKSIPGFEGGRSKNTILVLVLGFDGKVAIRIREEYSAEKVILINGFPSYLPKFRDISLLNNKDLVNACSIKDIYSTYSDNPFEIYNVLVKIQKRYPEYKLLIAPLGAKPLALGICKFAIDNPTTAVLYVESERYIEKSTYEYGETWKYKMKI